MQLQTKHVGIFAALVLLMAVTRGSHFGSSAYLPDATLAVFLLGGFFLARFSWVAMLAFGLLLLEAGGIDYYAINVAGVSDWCVTPAYGFLIPTYAIMWLGGSWFAKQQQSGWRSLALFGGVAWLATTLAFLVSNGSFYLFSGRYSEMGVAEYAGNMAQYYPPYLAGSLMYLALAAVAYVLLGNANKAAAGTAQS